MFDLRLLELARDRLKNDSVMQDLMGVDFEMFLIFGTRIPKMPYIVHSARIKGSNQAVVIANYYLDIYDSGIDRAKLMQIVQRVRFLMERYIDPEGGGIRFFWRDTMYSTQNETVQKAQILYHVRGVDQDQCY